MRSFTIVALVSVASAVQAHFTLSFPPPRGEFNEDEQPNYCGGYNDVNTSRSEFPLTGGFVNIDSHHESWTIGFLMSNSDSPESFNDFTQIGTFAKATGEGDFCLPLDLQATNATVEDAMNRTIQLVFDGGDGALYACADVTLSSSVDISSVSCANATESEDGHEHDEESSSTTASSPASATESNSGIQNRIVSISGFVSVLLGVSAIAFLA